MRTYQQTALLTRTVKDMSITDSSVLRVVPTGRIRSILNSVFELSNASDGRLLAMEGLRGLAVGLVFICHFFAMYIGNTNSNWLQYASDFVPRVTHIGVDLFFILSGFLIYKPLISRDINLKNFWIRRIKRIYPTYTAVFVVYLALTFLMPQFSKLPSNTIDAITWVVASFFLIPGMWPIDSFIVVAWSLSYEFFFYLVMPLIIIGLRMQSWTSNQRIFFFAMLSLLGIGLMSALGGPIRLSVFLFGVILLEIIQFKKATMKLPSAAGLVAAGISIALYGACVWFKLPHTISITAIGIGFFILVYDSFTDESLANRVFKWTPLRWLGNMSFSFYLLHGLVIKAVFLALGMIGLQKVALYSSNGLLFLFLACFIAAFCGSAVLFVSIEKKYSLS